MRPLRRLLLGFLLLAFSGCGKTEEKTEAAKTEAGNTEAPDKTAATNAEQPKSSTGTPASFAQAKDFSLVPQGTVALVSVRPSAALGSQLVKSLPNQEDIAQAMAMMEQNVGFDVSNIARVSIALWPGEGHVLPGMMDAMNPRNSNQGRRPAPEEFQDPNFDFKEECDAQPPEEFEAHQGGPGGFNPLQMIKNFLPKFDGAVMVQFNNAVDLNQLTSNMPPQAQIQNATVEGLSLKVIADIPIAGGVALWQPNSTMLVVTFKDDVADIVKGLGSNALVTQALAEGTNSAASVQLSLTPFQTLLAMGSGFAQGQVKDSENLPKQLKSLSLFVGLNDGADVNLLIDTTDPTAVQNIKEAFDQQYKGMEDQVAAASQTLPPGTNEDVKTSVQKLADDVYSSVKSEAKGNQFRLSLRVPGNAVEVAQKVQAEQAKLFIGLNNLKQIGLAAHNYHDTTKKFPFPAGEFEADAAEKGKLSWRVHLLPYLDEGFLYEQFKLDEPWDSEHNKALLDKMPDVFKLNDETKPGHTQFVAPAGKGFIVDGDQTRSIATMTDGTSNLIMVLSVKPDQAQPWTKPGGFDLDPAKAAEILGGHPNGFLALFGDGSVQVIKPTLDAETLKGLLTISGGEVIDRDSLD